VSRLIRMDFPAPVGHRFGTAGIEGFVGQWFTLLIYGESVMARVLESSSLDDGLHVRLLAEVGSPEEEDIPEPAFTFGTPGPAPSMHINCEHAPSATGNLGAVVCDGPLP